MTYPRGTSYFTLQYQIIAVICTHVCAASFLLEKTINKIIDLIPGEQGLSEIKHINVKANKQKIT